MRILILSALFLGGCGGILDKETEAKFKSSLGSTSVTVYPVVVRGSEGPGSMVWDKAAAKELALWIEEKKLAKVTLATDELQFAARPGMNQARMFRGSMTAFAESVKSTPPRTDYAMTAEYLMGRRGVGGVHVYVVSREGDLVYGFLSNSHMRAFRRIKPKTAADATRVAIDTMNRDLIEKR